ncbi:hypothetical protein GCM10007063_22350 [Lentibacillus kapialis]|uniref:Adenosylcobinamide kinase n=1 Tax=Lentibacillus kapialis TaxID=340214 RepID=A0A917UZE1_9BACI|nr:bifunctional adenosylcobinamide kinase/adenosylcobinamide-phosphate guanylyltransferase [Lentibacillus kapialis]GGJ99522.1 hypothetical protein GCM10007063_22350 [Lentibacillus kapialis]
MHFITGGAYNGKRKWVKDHYAAEHYIWLSAYSSDALTKPLQNYIPSLAVLEGLEEWIRTQIDSAFSPYTLRQRVMDQLGVWLEWEQANSCRRLVIIGTDTSKGIVPMDKRQRYLRDVTGWVYQDIVAQAERADVIWYGIAQTIKNDYI